MRKLRVGIGVGVVVASATCVAGGPQQFAPFTDEAASRGLAYMMDAYPQSVGVLGYGCGFVDLDVDGDPDIVIMGAANGRVGIFENNGAGVFLDRSKASGIPLLGGSSAFTSADYDGDGLPDLYFTQCGADSGEPNLLVRNGGGFQFVDVTAIAGVGDAGAGTGACFGDYDGDGWLDLYVCNYNGATGGTDNIDNKLYRNLGAGVFEEVGVALGVDDGGLGFQAVWFDVERDGDLDLYLSNDRGHLPPLFIANRLWRNDGGVFVDISDASGAGVALFSMGIACGDFDGNGLADLYVTNIDNYEDGYNPLLLNQDGATFVESSASAGVANWITSWGSIFFDSDNNGHQDLYVNNMFLPNSLFICGPAFPCVEIAGAADIGGNTGPSFCSAVADVDGDGDLDLLENNLGHNVELFINHEGDLRNWMRYRMVGLYPNPQAVGGNVDTRTGLTWQWREVLAGGNGFLGQNELTLHVGMDTADCADEVVATWPGGSPTRTLTNLPANETWAIYPPQRLGDADGDLEVTLDDFLVFAGCDAAGFGPGCEMMDFDGNSVLDLDDFTAFLAVYADPLNDCDGDGALDLLEILLDPGLDSDGTGIPDGCEAAGDLDGNGEIRTRDLLILLLAWGPCPGPPAPCPADLDGDGSVTTADLFTLLANWS